jgi:hypothetical protein
MIAEKMKTAQTSTVTFTAANNVFRVLNCHGEVNTKKSALAAGRYSGKTYGGKVTLFMYNRNY